MRSRLFPVGGGGVCVADLELVDDGAEGGVDFFERTEALHGVALAFLLVPVDKGSSLVVVYVETLFDGFGVVVGTAGSLTAVDEAFHEHVFGHVEFKHAGYFGVAFGEHGLERFCLGNGAGETVKDDAFAGAECIVGGCKDVDHERVGDELSLVDVALGSVAEFSAVLDFGTEHVASGDVLEAVFLYEQVALCAFARSGGTEDNDILHFRFVV